MNDMKQIFNELKDGAITWGSFAVFIALELVFIYGLFKLAGVI